MGIVAYQVTLMREQQTTMRRQTEIMEKQDELLARRAHLIMRVSREPYIDMQRGLPFVRLQFMLWNEGTRWSGPYYWHLLLPRSLDDIPIVLDPVTDLPIDRGLHRHEDGAVYHYYSDYTTDPIIPNRAAVLAIMRVSQDRFPFTCLWEAACEDGAFPDDPPGPYAVTLAEDTEC